MSLIERKKKVYAVNGFLMEYLQEYDRFIELPVLYGQLERYMGTVPVYNKIGEDTLWETCLYTPAERDEINQRLLNIYATLKVMGHISLMEHLVTDRVDVCTWGNTRPFRIRILNTLNENFDYFYIKVADASRIYGLELEHILSPNRILFLCDGNIIVEEHIAGIPGDDFIKKYLLDTHLDEVRLAKEFVKFNERCFVRLLGDMHAGNFVVDVTPDFDETVYRLRAIDFDQQSYEGSSSVYKAQNYTENRALVDVGDRCMDSTTYQQYREEERTLIAKRARSENKRLLDLMQVMANEDLAPHENIIQLRRELTEHYRTPAFLGCESMGDLVYTSLELLHVA